MNRTPASTPLALSLLLLVASNASTAQAPPPNGVEDGDWNYVATLDGKPIGTHHFVVSGPASDRTVESEARFAVRILGIPAYSYSHHAQEHWQGDCLRSLRSDTDDDGKAEHVDQRYGQGCEMSFAYWNPRLVHQHRLVNPQTGQAEDVRFDPVPDTEIEARGRRVAAHGFRLDTPSQHITLWYAADDGHWVGLDAVVKNERTLSYRLAPGG